MWSRGPRARRWLLVVEVLLAAFLCSMSVAVAARGSMAWFSVGATIAILLAFLVRRRSTRWSFALAALAGGLQLIDAHGFIMFGDLLYAPVCAAFGASRNARTRRMGLMAAVAAAVVPGALVLPRWLGSTASPPHLPELVTLCVMFTCVSAVVSVGGWAWGYLRLQQRLRVEAALATQVSEVERARLEETYAQSAFRERIAAEMHDVVGHSWAVVAAQADGARYALRTSPESAEKALETIADLARTSITELRDILRQLRYVEGEEGQIGAEQQAALIARMRQSGMTLDYEETGTPAASRAVRLAAHRILTEALTNALKHADLSHPVEATLRWDDGFELDVANRVGRRSDPAGGGLGLGGMRERARSLGGEVDITAHAGTWHLRVVVPAPPAPIDRSRAFENLPAPAPGGTPARVVAQAPRAARLESNELQENR